VAGLALAEVACTNISHVASNRRCYFGPSTFEVSMSTFKALVKERTFEFSKFY